MRHNVEPMPPKDDFNKNRFLKFDPETEPWVRQPGEGDLAYKNFLIYRDLAGGKRSVKTMCDRGLTDSHPSVVARWRYINRWVERCIAWDRFLQKEAEDEAVRQRKKRVREQFALLDDVREVVSHDVQVLLARARDSNNDDQTLLQPKELSKLLEKSITLNRLLNEESTANVQDVTKGPREIVHRVVRVSEDDLEAMNDPAEPEDDFGDEDEEESD